MTTPRSAKPKVLVRDVTPARWEDMEQRFSAQGGPKHCWCMAWRADQKDPKSTSGAGRKILMKQRVHDGGAGRAPGRPGRPAGGLVLAGAPFDTFHGLRKAAEDEEHVGFVPLFESAGFTEVAREGTRRHVIQWAVRPPRR